ncbi:MAG: spore cortex biosynthesis protein YabQ [Clostridia bacterium]
MNNQAYIFLIFIFNGLIIGILFDIFRIMRKSFKTSDFITNLQDILFWFFTGLILLYSIFKFNNGELRAYIFFGVLLGVALYILLFSKIFIKVNLFIVNTIKQAAKYLIIIPIKYIFKFIRKIILAPISFIFINIRKNLSNFKKKIISLHYKMKKDKFKKDFT